MNYDKVEVVENFFIIKVSLKNLIFMKNKNENYNRVIY